MPLAEIDIAYGAAELPEAARALLRDGESRAAGLEERSDSPPGFVPCRFARVAHAVRAVADDRLAQGTTFCEWGSGLGVVASLASLFGFDACGIEIDPALITASRALATRHRLSVEFVEGSFVPPGGESLAAAAGREFFWMATTTDDAYETLGLMVEDFAVVFAFPWPAESEVITQLFERYARVGALLLTYHQSGAVCLHRKVRGR